MSVEQGRMINDAALMTLGGGSHTCDVTLGSYQVWEKERIEVKYEAFGLHCGYDLHPCPHL